MKDKRSIWPFIAAALLVAGCEYKQPLTEEHNIPIDPALIGLWEAVPPPGKPQDPKARMLILRYSDTEYLIHSPAEKDGIYYRGYLIEIGGKRYVQLEVLGLEEAPVPDDEDELFHVAAYDLKQGILEVSLLNSKLVNAESEDAVALRKSFMEHLDDATLFKPHQRYRRCAGEHEDSSQ